MNRLPILLQQLNSSVQAWEATHSAASVAALSEKERDMREALRRDRDQEIEKVISRLEHDDAASRADFERATDARLLFVPISIFNIIIYYILL